MASALRVPAFSSAPPHRTPQLAEIERVDELRFAQVQLAAWLDAEKIRPFIVGLLVSRVAPQS